MGMLAVMERSFERALALSGGQRAGLFVAYAEARAVPAAGAGDVRSNAGPGDGGGRGRPARRTVCSTS